MEVVLKRELFDENNTFTVEYGGNKEARFILTDEIFTDTHIAEVDRINVLIRTLTDDGSEIKATLQPAIIGVGNRIVGVRTDVPALRGKLLSSKNMEQCVVILYE